MKLDRWDRIASVAPGDLADAVLELHWATQLVAAAGQTFVTPRGDDSHRAMTWDGTLDGFLGEAFAHGYPFRLGLRVHDLTLHLLDRTDATLGVLPLGGASLDDAYVWLRTGLSQYMGGTGPQIERPEFRPPEHAVGAGARFSTGLGKELGVLAALYGGAAEILDGLAGSTPGASPVRCWPHHFDIATLITLPGATIGDGVRTVGVGMAPMGGGYDTWYWYVTPWPYPDADALPALDPPARWHTEGWTGAVLRGTDVVAAPATRRRGRIVAFIEEAVATATRALEG
jgi:hypothetical protein